MILSLLQAHFNVRTILMHGRDKTPVDIIGAPEDVDFAVYALAFLRETFFRCWNEFKRRRTTRTRHPTTGDCVTVSTPN